MRKTDTERIDKVIDAVFRQMGVSQKMKEMRVVNAWPEIIGKNIARSTKKVSIYNRTLFLHMSSPAVKNELLMLKSALVKAVNDFSKEDLIDEVIIR